MGVERTDDRHEGRTESGGVLGGAVESGVSVGGRARWTLPVRKENNSSMTQGGDHAPPLVSWHQR